MAHLDAREVRVMIGALIIVFREVIEAGIVVGIVMAVTQGIAGAKLRGEV